jgi:hypothetical protein
MYGDALPVTLSERLTAIVGGLLISIGNRARVDGVLRAIVLLVAGRIMRARNEVLSVIARIEAGTLKQAPVRRAPATPRTMDEAARKQLTEAAAKWASVPRRIGWLIRLVGYEAAGYASQLSYLLQDEEMKRHLATTPRLGRALRPLCRMLGMDLAGRAPGGGVGGGRPV